MSKSSLSIWYPRYVGDYQRKTSHLSLVEHGAYTLLLDHYYSTEKPLPASASVLHRVCRAFAPEEQAAVQSVVDQFFTLESDGYHNGKADEELIKRGDISEKRRKAAESRYAKAPAKAPAIAYTSTSTSTTTSIVKKDPPKAASKSKRSAIPENWTPSEKDISHAKDRKLDSQTIAAVGEQFRDHHISKGTLFANHSAAWRTWVKNHIGYHGTGTWPSNGKGGPGKNNGGRQSLTTARNSVIAEIELYENGGADRVHIDGRTRGESDRGGEADSQIVVEGDFTPRSG